MWHEHISTAAWALIVAIPAAAFTGWQALVTSRQAKRQSNPMVGFKWPRPYADLANPAFLGNQEARAAVRFRLVVLGNTPAINLTVGGEIDFGSGPARLHPFQTDPVDLHQLTAGEETGDIMMAASGPSVEQALRSSDHATIHLRVDYLNVLFKRYCSRLTMLVSVQLVEPPVGQANEQVSLEVGDVTFRSSAILRWSRPTGSFSAERLRD